MKVKVLNKVRTTVVNFEIVSKDSIENLKHYSDFLEFRNPQCNPLKHDGMMLQNDCKCPSFCYSSQTPQFLFDWLWFPQDLQFTCCYHNRNDRVLHYLHWRCTKLQINLMIWFVQWECLVSTNISHWSSDLQSSYIMVVEMWGNFLRSSRLLGLTGAHLFRIAIKSIALDEKWNVSTYYFSRVYH